MLSKENLLFNGIQQGGDTKYPVLGKKACKKQFKWLTQNN
jgi:hypothetical protein